MRNINTPTQLAEENLRLKKIIGGQREALSNYQRWAITVAGVDYAQQALWTDKVVEKIAEVLGREFTNSERYSVKQAIFCRMRGTSWLAFPDDPCQHRGNTTETSETTTQKDPS